MGESILHGCVLSKDDKHTAKRECDHLLKGYVLPGCPMHLFIRQYEKMQFDRDSEESYQERRTKVVRLN